MMAIFEYIVRKHCLNSVSVPLAYHEEVSSFSVLVILQILGLSLLPHLCPDPCTDVLVPVLEANSSCSPSTDPNSSALPLHSSFIHLPVCLHFFLLAGIWKILIPRIKFQRFSLHLRTSLLSVNVVSPSVWLYIAADHYLHIHNC